MAYFTKDTKIIGADGVKVEFSHGSSLPNLIDRPSQVEVPLADDAVVYAFNPDDLPQFHFQWEWEPRGFRLNPRIDIPLSEWDGMTPLWINRSLIRDGAQEGLLRLIVGNRPVLVIRSEILYDAALCMYPTEEAYELAAAWQLWKLFDWAWRLTWMYIKHPRRGTITINGQTFECSIMDGVITFSAPLPAGALFPAVETERN